MANQPAEDSARIELTVPTDLKAKVQAAAADGGESVSAYTRRLWSEDLRKKEKK